MLNIPLFKWNDAGKPDILKADHQLNKASYLFEKIEDIVIDRQIQKLMNTKTANKAEELSVTPVKENIEYDDFAKMDIRTATILEAEKVPKTQKLLKLKIDTGLDKRTIISGIAEYYKAEDIIGQKIVVLANLSPRKIRGTESMGMILMAEDIKGKLCFVSPTENFHNGSTVK
jgi:methionyl-tRNA synthetase